MHKSDKFRQRSAKKMSVIGFDKYKTTVHKKSSLSNDKELIVDDFIFRLSVIWPRLENTSYR